MLWQGQTSCWQFLGRVNLDVGMLRLEAGLCAQNGVCTQLVVNMLGSWAWHLSSAKRHVVVVRSSRSISSRNNSRL